MGGGVGRRRKASRKTESFQSKDERLHLDLLLFVGQGETFGSREETHTVGPFLHPTPTGHSSCG